MAVDDTSTTEGLRKPADRQLHGGLRIDRPMRNNLTQETRLAFAVAAFPI